ncbi:hypothetical protein Bca52824_017239 [Brassica carinata]|uniref:Sucrose phosphatase-like domain-containing protein n=1 Tax=Brassica carinata TaxID=52824 RepID=A0A8X7VMZ0_BRACI|nr:hypothetical protein Bca52824_017239 [Brassica carinata]
MCRIGSSGHEERSVSSVGFAIGSYGSSVRQDANGSSCRMLSVVAIGIAWLYRYRIIGTEIAYGKSMVTDDTWADIMNHKWDRGIVQEETSKFLELTLQNTVMIKCRENAIRANKVSFFIDKSKAQEVTKELYQRLEKRGLEIKIIFGGGKALDVLPNGGGKGQALAYLLNNIKTEGKLPLNNSCLW